MIVPQEKKFKENLEKGVMIYKKLKEVLKEKYQNGSTNLGDEGGYVPPIKKTKEALNLIEKTIKRLGYQKKIKLGLDCASSQFFKNGRYFLEGEVLNREGLLKFYEKILKEYPILFLEDPFSENDLKGWEILYDKYQEKKDFYIVGDDLTVSNPLRITMAKEKKLINALILKPNQIGTITEVFESSRLCKKFGFKIIVSHRSQETNDDFIADLAVGIKADFIKSGAPARGERVAKYNRLLKIEEEILNE
jgi:enolase